MPSLPVPPEIQSWPAPPIDVVVLGVAEQAVVAGAAVDGVVAGLAVDLVGAAAPSSSVTARTTMPRPAESS